MTEGLTPDQQRAASKGWVVHGPDYCGSDPHIVNIESGEIEDLETYEEAVGRAVERNEEDARTRDIRSEEVAR